MKSKARRNWTNNYAREQHKRRNKQSNNAVIEDLPEEMQVGLNHDDSSITLGRLFTSYLLLTAGLPFAAAQAPSSHKTSANDVNAQNDGEYTLLANTVNIRGDLSRISDEAYRDELADQALEMMHKALNSEPADRLSLHAAVNSPCFDEKAFGSILKQAPELLNKPNNNGETPLYLAIKSQKFDAAKYLIQKGADVNIITTSEKLSLLDVAIQADASHDFMDLLLEKNRHLVNTQRGDGHFPILYALSSNNATLFRYLVGKGADTNFTLYPDSNLLHIAVEQRLSKKIINEIIKANPGLLERTDNNGKTPADVAKEQGNKELVELFANKLQQSKSREQVLLSLVDDVKRFASGELSCPKEIRTFFTKFDQYGLHNEKNMILKMMLADKSDWVSYPDLLAVFIDYNASTELIDDVVARYTKEKASWSRAAVNYAWSFIYEEKGLLDTLDSQGLPPVYRAVVNEKTKLVRHLINKGVALDYKNENGSSLVHIAAEKGNKSILNVLLKANQERGGDVSLLNQLDKNDLTPLASGLMHRQFTMFEYLVKKGADTSIINSKFFSRSLLHFAAEHGASKGIIDLILAKNPEFLELKDAEGATPLYLAEHFKQDDVAQYLKEKMKAPSEIISNAVVTQPVVKNEQKMEI